MLQVIEAAVLDRSARGIAAAISRLITSGELPAGARLPTVRAVATALGVSPTTTSEAWRSLAQAGAIATRGRSGTFVLPRAGTGRRLRYAQLSATTATAARASVQDLSTGVPDHALLASLGPALRRVGDVQLTTSYLDEPVLPPLEALLREHWPYAPPQLTIVDGALDALDRTTATVVRFGDRVLVENPAFPPTVDLLEAAGATIVPVAVDERGVRPDAVQAGLDQQPVALYLQPRAHNPTGASMDPQRASELAAVIAGHRHGAELLVVEDDHAGAIATAAPVSLGTHLPERTVHVHSFSKSHGPDLRMAAVAGPADVLTAIVERRMLGPGWSSRLLQAVLLGLLTDEAAQAQVAHARQEYARRRTALLDELAKRQVRASAGDGINMWVEVADQQVALLSLAAHGVAAAPGAPFELCPLGSDHIRITVGLVRDGFDKLADILAEAARSPHRASGRRRLPLPRSGR